jgi:LmbE family N-acetylglucosaminyl deacetylase
MRRYSSIYHSALVFLASLLFAMPLYAQHRHVMVIAPHEDDETLFGAGVIYSALQRGDTVTVVWVTNGDANGVSTGYAREADSVNAMAGLGIASQNLIFLGYGDSSLEDLYLSTSDTAIITSPAGMTHTYGNQGLGNVDYHTYLTGSPGDYNRATILSDFEALFTNFQPDDIYTTSYLDEHLDHASTYSFTVQALIALKRQGLSLSTRVHDSIVWGDTDSTAWPTGGANPAIPFSMPPILATVPYNWSDIESIPVPPAMQNTDLNANPKYQALLVYLSVPSEFFASFIRKNEFFWVHDFTDNLAVTASVQASSQNAVNTAMKAVDGVVERNGGFVGYWETLGESAGAWIRLNWGSPETISHIVLYDQPDSNQILAGTLLFSDGSTVAVGALPNNGSAFHIAFPARTVSWVQFTVNNALGSDIGLNEIEVYGVVAGSQANNAPQIVSGPLAVQTQITDSQTLNLSLNAFDVNSDVLQYDWTTDGGVITGGAPTALFQPSPVVSDTVVTITANVTDGKGGTATNSTFVTVSPSTVKVQSVSISPTAVQGGTVATGTVTLGSAAQSGGTVVQLGSSDSSVGVVPASLTVPAGATVGTFSVTTSQVSTLVTLTISASCGGVTKTGALMVMPVAVPVASLALNPASVIAGDSSTGTVTLKGPASGSGTTVALASTSSTASVPSTVLVPAGSSTATFTVKTSLTNSSVTATISASAGGSSASSDLRITAKIAPNLATIAAVSVSSENAGTGQLGIKAIDTVIDGYPGDYTKEWAANGQLAGAWIQLSWANLTTVSQVVLYDRPNSVDNILAGTLSFSDGSTVPVGALPNSGGLQVTFSARTISWLKFQVDNAVGTNTGLAEIAVYGPTVSGISSVVLNPPTVVGGNSSTGTVTLSTPAPSGGAVVALVSSNTSVASVPGSVTVAANATTATFQVTTNAVASNTSVTISASYNGTTQNANLNVIPVAVTLSALTLSPGSVVGGNPSTGTVTLSGPAPSGGAVVTLVSSNTSVGSVPSSVTVVANATTATFQVTTNAVASNTSVTISASYNGTTQNANLTVTPVAVALSALTVSPGSVVGGSPSTGTVTLSGPAPSGGAVVTLVSSNASVASVPGSVTVAANATTATFQVTTNVVASNTPVTISATYNGTTQNANLNVSAAALTVVSVSPTSVRGGTPSTGTVTLSGPAGAGGAVILLSSNNPSAATVPATVTVPASSMTATFTVTTVPVLANTTATVSAVYGSTTRTAALTVTAATLSSVSLRPTSLPGGSPSTGTVTLNGPAPASGATILLSSNNSSVAAVPASVTIPANSTTASFAVSTVPVASNTTVTISGTYGSATRSANLGVTAATLSSVTLSPSSVRGGSPSTGTVTLNGPAPAAGAVVTLSSGNTSVATVPSSTVVPGGSTTATFTISTLPVTRTRTVTISGTRGVQRSASLTVTQ